MKRNTLTTAVLAGLTGMAGMVSVSNATGVHVNPEGHGQALIYPFYTARGGNDTLISIVNTHERGKAVKVRFREALNSREVLDFHLYMSPFDVWTAAVTSNDDGGATLFTNDTSCTVPAIPADGVDFLTFDYTETTRIDGAGTEVERTASGYVEVIEMASMVSEDGVKATSTTSLNPISDAEEIAAREKAFAELSFSGWLEYTTKHTSAGEPRSCTPVLNAWTSGLPSSAVKGGAFLQGRSGDNTALAPAVGGLFGSASIINVEAGTMFSYEATALDAFWENNYSIATAHAVPGRDAPNLASTGNKVAHIFAPDSQGVGFGQFTPVGPFEHGIQAVSAALMQDRMFNEYVVDAAIGAKTEWVVTFPTKAYHVDPFQAGQDGSFGSDPLGILATRGGIAQAGQRTGGAAARSTVVAAPFVSGWNTARASVGAGSAIQEARAFSPACEASTVTIWDREERKPSSPTGSATGPVFSPAPDAGLDVARPRGLCSEANVISFSDADATFAVGDATAILAEPARASGLGAVNLAVPFDAGWAEIDFSTAQTTGISIGGVAQPSTRKRKIQTVAGAAAGAGFNDDGAVEGLPVVGFAVNTYTNGDLGAGVLANYGGTFNHRGTRSIISS